jgi:hypothetical protein
MEKESWLLETVGQKFIVIFAAGLGLVWTGLF